MFEVTFKLKVLIYMGTQTQHKPKLKMDVKFINTKINELHKLCAKQWL